MDVAATTGTTSEVHYVRIWSDAEGQSHLEDIRLPARTVPAEMGVPSLLVSESLAARGLEFVTVVGGTLEPDWHTAPRRQLVVFLTGRATVEVSDGARRTLPIGGAVLVEDTWGRGHVTRHPPGDQRVLVVPLATVDS